MIWKKKRKSLDLKISKIFYINTVSFNIADSEAFKEDNALHPVYDHLIEKD